MKITRKETEITYRGWKIVEYEIEGRTGFTLPYMLPLEYGFIRHFDKLSEVYLLIDKMVSDGTEKIE